MKNRKIIFIIASLGLVSLTLAGCRLTPGDTIAKSMEKMAALKTVSTALDLQVNSNGQTASVSGTFQNELPDRSSLRLESNGQSNEIVATGESSYFLLEPRTKKWVSIQSDTLSQMGIFPSSNAQMTRLRGAMTNLDGKGQDTLN